MSRRPVPVAVAIGLLAVLVAAGCFGPGSDPGDETPPTAFDGEAAHDFVAGLVTDDAGDPRFRVPGTSGHADGAAWLWDALEVDGWERAWQNFTGETYQGLDHGAVAQYTSHPTWCSQGQEAHVASLDFSNLLARWDTPSDRVAVLGAHWESKAHATQDPDPAKRGDPVLGANDGASGVGVLLQAMRHIAAGDVTMPFDVEVVLFDGEDGFEDCHPLAGSLYYARTMDPGLEARMLLLDMVGDPDARFIQEQRSTESDPDHVALWWRLGPELMGAEHLPPVRDHRTHHCSVLDDHVPFVEEGVPAMDLIDFGRGIEAEGSGHCAFPPYWHTTHDTLDKVTPGMLEGVGATLLAVLADPEFAADWPPVPRDGQVRPSPPVCGPPRSTLALARAGPRCRRPGRRRPGGWVAPDAGPGARVDRSRWPPTGDPGAALRIGRQAPAHRPSRGPPPGPGRSVPSHWAEPAPSPHPGTP